MDTAQERSPFLFPLTSTCGLSPQTPLLWLWGVWRAGHVASGGQSEPQGRLCGQKRTAGPPALKGSPAPQVHGHHGPGRGQVGEPLGGGGSLGLILGVRLYERALPSSLFTTPRPPSSALWAGTANRCVRVPPAAARPGSSLAAGGSSCWETPVEGVPDAGSQPHSAVSGCPSAGSTGLPDSHLRRPSCRLPKDTPWRPVPLCGL